MAFLYQAVDPYGFHIAKSNGGEARHFKYIALPRELPEPVYTKPVTTYQMDDGIEHPGYLVRDVHTIDDSYGKFSIAIGKVLPVDMDWLQTLFKTSEVVLISWKTGVTWSASFQENGYVPRQYPLNVREFGRVELSFLLGGQVGTNISV